MVHQSSLGPSDRVSGRVQGCCVSRHVGMWRVQASLALAVPSDSSGVASTPSNESRASTVLEFVDCAAPLSVAVLVACWSRVLRVLPPLRTMHCRGPIHLLSGVLRRMILSFAGLFSAEAPGCPCTVVTGQSRPARRNQLRHTAQGTAYGQALISRSKRVAVAHDDSCC
jgi:hypothetical protein